MPKFSLRAAYVRVIAQGAPRNPIGFAAAAERYEKEAKEKKK